MKQKILFFITDLETGGAERMLEKIVLRLDRKKYDLLVCTLINGGEIKDNLEKNGIELFSLHAQNSVHFFKAIKNLRKIIKKERPDILHCWMFHANIIGRIAAIRLSCKVISSIRNKFIDKPLFNILDRLTQGLVDIYTVNSKSIRNFVIKQGLSSKKIILIENGIDIDWFDPNQKPNLSRSELNINNSYPIICSIANLRKQKDYPTLINAISQLKKPINLLIVGGHSQYEDETKKIKQLIKTLKLSNIYFLGKRDDIPAILKLSDIWISTTLFEGQSNSLLEAMAMKKAIITTNIPENSEVVTDNREALLVKVKSPQETAKAIKRLIDDPDLKEQLEINAYKKVRNNYTIERTVKKLTDLYERLTK